MLSLNYEVSLELMRESQKEAGLDLTSPLSTVRLILGLRNYRDFFYNTAPMIRSQDSHQMQLFVLNSQDGELGDKSLPEEHSECNSLGYQLMENRRQIFSGLGTQGPNTNKQKTLLSLAKHVGWSVSSKIETVSPPLTC